MAEKSHQIKTRRLMVFTISRMEDVQAKGNVWYVRHYESYFDEVYVVYLFGREKRAVSEGRITLVSLAGRSRWLNLILAPIRLYLLARKIGPSVFLTSDQVFSWWTGMLLRWLMGAKIVLMPVSMPNQLYQDRGASQTGLPISAERLFLAASYWTADKIITARAFGGYVDWLANEPIAKRKLIVLRTVVDALPTPAFFDSLSRIGCRRKCIPWFQLIYVGRLHREKLVDHLLQVMEIVRCEGYDEKKMRLKIVGDGSDRYRLEGLAKELKVDNSVEFHGAVSNSELPSLLVQADAFVSPLTGTALREAALCRLPIVAYDRDWIHGLLVHETTALLVPSGDIKGFAAQVIRLARDPLLRQTVAENAYQLAQDLWSISSLQESLALLARATSGDLPLEHQIGVLV